jgi:hypothetical protein
MSQQPHGLDKCLDDQNAVERIAMDETCRRAYRNDSRNWLTVARFYPVAGVWQADPAESVLDQLLQQPA